MQVEIIRSAEDLARLGPQWNELVAASETDNPFLQWEWCSTWWRHYGAGHELVVVLVRDGDQLIGLAPLYVERGKNAREPGVMKFLGTGEVCSEYLGFVLRCGRQEEADQELIRFLLNDSTIRWRQLRLTHVLASGPTATLLQASLPRCQRPFRFDQETASWIIELAESWDAFLKSVGSNRREKLRRALRGLDKNQLEFHEVTSEAEIDATWADLKRLHQARWERDAKPGCFASTRFAEFHRELLRLLWRRGMLSLTSLRRDGQVLAASYCLRHLGRVYFYQSGIDPDAMQFRPGHSLRVCELRRAIERGDRVFDLLSGDEEYKTQWATNRTEMVEFTIAGRGFLPRVRFGLQSATQWTKESVRSHLPDQTWATLRRWRKQLTEKHPFASPKPPTA